MCFLAGSATNLTKTEQASLGGVLPRIVNELHTVTPCVTSTVEYAFFRNGT